MVGSQNLSMGVNETYPGGMVPDHIHEKEEEVMLFLAGRGMFITDDEQIPWSRGWPYTIRPAGSTGSSTRLTRSCVLSGSTLRN